MNNNTTQITTAAVPAVARLRSATAPLPAGAQLEARDLLPPLPARQGVSPLARDRASLLARRAMYLPV
jgi:hypothetical protein